MIHHSRLILVAGIRDLFSVSREKGVETRLGFYKLAETLFS